ncbi:unnamed protein product [marine sediment metagenome]|uniref:HNH nuclease domain-containing protein n=1 Tax=marine sediment metagenome TaxID=412755 RepID=X1T2X1_9ZZZZ
MKTKGIKLTDASKRDLFRGYYKELKWSITEIAELLHIDPATVRYYLEKYQIPRRSISEGLNLAYAIGRKRIRPITGPANPSWKGGRTFADGYIYVRAPGHPRARNGYVAEHILIWEQTHNQPLPPGWVIHHLNGIGIDNRPENIVGLPDRKHKRVLTVKAQRIKELEFKLAKVEREMKSLREAMLAGQLIFNLDGHDDL